MSPTPISVVMPLYNNATEVSTAIRSVLSQTYACRELIVVNDGSTDGGEKVVRAMREARVRLLDQENNGVSAARNRGVAEATSGIVAFLDADDEWKPDFLETIARLHDNFPECSVFATHYLYKEVDGTIKSPILRRVPSGQWEGILPNYFNVAVHSDPPLWSSAVSVQKSALLSIGGFPAGIAIGEDLLTWARLAAQYRIAYSTRQCAIFRLRAPLSGFPTRTPALPDLVGEQFARMLPGMDDQKRVSFRRYVSKWHGMRASMFIQLKDRKHALEEVGSMFRYSAGDPRAYLYAALALTPKMIRKLVLQFFTFVKRVWRRFSAR